MTKPKVYNAAGPRSKTSKDLEALLEAAIPVITIGSISLEPSLGNAQKKYWYDSTSGVSLNSMGLPNKGLVYYERFLPNFISQAHSKKKLVRVSIVGSRPNEYAELVRKLLPLGVDQIEVNASCPNVWHGTKQSRITCFDVDLLEQLVSATTKAAKDFKLDYKLSPYSDPMLLQQVAKIFNKYRSVRAVVTANTFPNAYSAKTGLAGFGGDAYRHIVLGQVKQLRALLPARIKVVGLGGVSARKHVREYLKAGAAEVQVGTHYFEQGPDVFQELC